MQVADGAGDSFLDALFAALSPVGHDVEGELLVFEGSQGEVHSRDAVVVVSRLTSGVEEADVVIPPQGAAVPENREEGFVGTGGVVSSFEVVLREEESELVLALGPCNLGAPERGDDVAGVQGGVEEKVAVPRCGQFEDTHPLHEEGPLLAVEEGKPLVNFDLVAVALHLAEVGVDGDLGGDGGVKSRLHVDPHIVVSVSSSPTLLALPDPVRGAREGGENLRGHGRREILEGHGVEASGDSGSGCQDRPGGGDPQTDIPSGETDAHGDLFPSLEADAPEGKGDLHLVTLFGDSATACPDEVRIPVHVSVVVHDPVTLDAVGVNDKGEAGLLEILGIDHDHDVVVVVHFIPGGDTPLQLAGVGIFAEEGEVEVLLVIGRIDRGFTGKGRAKGGSVTDEGELTPKALPRLVGEVSVDLRWGFHENRNQLLPPKERSRHEKSRDDQEKSLFHSFLRIKVLWFSNGRSGRLVPSLLTGGGISPMIDPVWAISSVG